MDRASGDARRRGRSVRVGLGASAVDEIIDQGAPTRDLPGLEVEIPDRGFAGGSPEVGPPLGVIELLGVIGDAHKKVHTLIVVGHNPGLHDLALVLIASGEAKARERITEKMPTSGLVVIDLPLDDWSLIQAQPGRLERFVSPSLIGQAPD